MFQRAKSYREGKVIEDRPVVVKQKRKEGGGQYVRKQDVVGKMTYK